MISYAIFRLFSKFIARLPWRCVYIFSDFLTLLLSIIRYRRKVALTNLSRSFPEKTRKEHLKILKESYRHISDMAVETMKTERMTKAEMEERMDIKGMDIIEKIYDSGKSVITLVAHSGTWEWMPARLQMLGRHQQYIAFKPLTNKRFDSYMQMTRQHFFPGRLVDYRTIFHFILRNKAELRSYILIADQTPTKSEIGYWADFMNQQTGFFGGHEKIAAKLGFGVIYIENKRIGRGRYMSEIKLITPDASKETEYFVTEKYARLLEQSLREQPENWLWTHKRWKHQPE